MLLNDLFCKFPISEVGDDEFYLIPVRPKSVEIWPMISFRFAGRGTLYIKDQGGPSVNAFCRDKTASLDQHLVTAIAKRGDEWKYSLLGKRFTARNLDQATAKSVERGNYLLKRHPLAAREGIFAVAPDAPHRAARQPHK